MSALFFLSDKSYEDLSYLDLPYSIIKVNKAQVAGVPKGSVIFTHNYEDIGLLARTGYKVVYNPRNSLSPSVISDLTYMEYNKNIQYLGSSVVKRYLQDYLPSLYNVWEGRFNWYDKDEQIGKILDTTLDVTTDFDLVIFTQSQIVPKAYALYLNSLGRNSKIAIVFHPAISPEVIDTILLDLNADTAVSDGYETHVRTGLKGFIKLIRSSEASRFRSSAKYILSYPGQIASEIQILNTKNAYGLNLGLLPKELSKHTDVKLGVSISGKFTNGNLDEYNVSRYHDPILASYDLSGSSESHIKPYKDLLIESIEYLR